MGERQRYPCNRCLRVLVAYDLSDYAGNNVVTTSLEARWGCARIARGISNKLYAGVSQRCVENIVTSLRADYIPFRTFLKLPGVSYDSTNDEIHVAEEYNRHYLPQETPEQRNYRINGFPLWDHLHETFRKRQFPNFESDPIELFVDPLVYSDSDEE